MNRAVDDIKNLPGYKNANIAQRRLGREFHELQCGFATHQRSLQPGPERRRLIALCAGLLFFAGLQAVFVFFGK